jgi:hypothetical protein
VVGGGWHFIVVFGTEGFGMGWGSLSLLPTGFLSAPVTILWLPVASLNCGSCTELTAWTWGSHGWQPCHSLHCHCRWLLPRCFWGGSMSVWLHWWIAVESSRNPFQKDRGFFPRSLTMIGKGKESRLDLKYNPKSPPPNQLPLLFSSAGLYFPCNHKTVMWLVLGKSYSR